MNCHTSYQLVTVLTDDSVCLLTGLTDQETGRLIALPGVLVSFEVQYMTRMGTTSQRIWVTADLG